MAAEELALPHALDAVLIPACPNGLSTVLGQLPQHPVMVREYGVQAGGIVRPRLVIDVLRKHHKALAMVKVVETMKDAIDGADEALNLFLCRFCVHTLGGRDS